MDQSGRKSDQAEKEGGGRWTDRWEERGLCKATALCRCRRAVVCGVFPPFLLLAGGGASDKVPGDCWWIKKDGGASGRKNGGWIEEFSSMVQCGSVSSSPFTSVLVPNALELCVDGWHVHEWTCESGVG